MGLDEYLVEDLSVKKRVSFRMSADLYDKVQILRHKNNHSWISIVSAGMKLYLKENGVNVGAKKK